MAMGCLVLAGIAQSMSMISAAVILMRTASAHLRGRVMGVRMMVIYGAARVAPAGSLIDIIGYSATGSLYADAGSSRCWRSRSAGAPTSGRSTPANARYSP